MNWLKQWKKGIHKNYRVELFHLRDDGVFPNNEHLPAVLFKQVLHLPGLMNGDYLQKKFKKHHWGNAWKNGIFNYHHYHSITHEVIGVYKGKTRVQLGGENGIKINIAKGDVLVIPAGVAHKNLDPDNKFKCVGAYPDSKMYDMNFGRPGERPQADDNIRNVPLPRQDPVFGLKGELQKIWKHPQ